MDKARLVEQLRTQIQSVVQGARRAASDAAEEARVAADPTDRSSDAKSAVELSRMAKGQSRRRDRALAELSALDGFRPRPLPETAPISVGALVEIEDEDSGEGRTFFLAPVGAGSVLLGPGGDGHVTVVTSKSPVGKSVLGQRVGEIIDVTLKGETREWAITWVG